MFAGKESDWMSQLPCDLHKVPLWNLAIPGSHDSMSYDLDINSSIIEPDRLKEFSKIYCAREIVRKWAVTQEETITQQLDAGIRYFDLRIAHKSDDNDLTRFYFYHGLCTRTDVETVLKVINDWAGRHPKEILILAFSHFKGFGGNEQLHSHLINLIKTLFETKLFCNNDTPTLKCCWEQGRNVIVSYDASHNSDMWSKITYFYGDTMDPAKVESKLEEALKAKPLEGFFVCGLNLTLPSDANILKYILRPCDTLASVIQRSLPRLLEWVRQQKGGKTIFNIVASDLVTRNNFVSTIIELNMK